MPDHVTRETARTIAEVFEAVTRWCWWERWHQTDRAKAAKCPDDLIRAPEALTAWINDHWTDLRDEFERCLVAVWETSRDHAQAPFSPELPELPMQLDRPAAPADPTVDPPMMNGRPERPFIMYFTVGRIFVELPMQAVTVAQSWLASNPPKDEPYERLFLPFNVLWATVHVMWIEARKHNPDLRHPLAPLVEAWLRETAPPVEHGKATVTGGSKRGMTRRVQIVSTVGRVGWLDAGRPGAIVDGEPLAAGLPDPTDLFPVRKRRPRRVFQPGEQRDLPFPSAPAIPADLRLIALQDLSGDPASSAALPGDVLTLLTFAHLADRPVELTERQGAALLVRNRDGKPRDVQPQHDYRRLWEAAAALRSLLVWEPNGGYRWVELATAEVPRVAPVDRLTIGPPAWARRQHVGKWTLTAEGSAASLSRVTAGQQSMAGRLVTGLEYWLAAGWTGRPNSVAPLLRPEHPRRKASPGAAVFIAWRWPLMLAGDWWDQTDPQADKAALARFNRAVATLKQRDYFVGEDLHREAPAGDSVEIVCRVRGSRRRPGGLMVRASARFVEAARLAQQPKGRGFETILLTDYTGLPIR